MINYRGLQYGTLLILTFALVFDIITIYIFSDTDLIKDQLVRKLPSPLNPPDDHIYFEVITNEVLPEVLFIQPSDTNNTEES